MRITPFFLLLLFWIPLTQALNIVVSIHPLALLIADLTQDTDTTITTLIPPTQSPHLYTLRPKQIQALEQADLVVWIGPSLETLLEKSILRVPQRAQIITLLDPHYRNIHALLYAPRTGAQWHDTLHTHQHTHDHEHHHGAYDPHIWLDPVLAIELSRVITQALNKRAPQSHSRYSTNFEQQALNLEKVNRELQLKFTHMLRHQNNNMLVLHDSYQYLEKRYGLPVKGVIALNPHRPLSAKQLQQAKNRIQQNQIHYILGEPPFLPNLIQTLTEHTQAQWIQLDPLGQALPLAPGNYIQLIRSVADHIVP